MIGNEHIPSAGGGGLPFTNGWTIDKLVKGAGVGLSPTEIGNFLPFCYGWTGGKLLKGNGVGAAPVEVSGWQVITELTLGSDVSYVDLNSLDINTDRVYVMFLNLRNVLAIDYTVVMYANGDYTDANYYSQVIDANGAVLTAARLTGPVIGGMPASNILVMMCYIMRDYNGYYRFYTFTSRLNGSAVVIQNWACCKTGTIANLTSLRLACGAAALGTGSTILMCKARTG